MHPKVFTRLFNIALRSTTLASKFILLFSLAKFLQPTQIGEYGLIVAAISYAIYLAGIEFHNHSTREIIKNRNGAWGEVLKNQTALWLTLYSILIPAIIISLKYNLLPEKFTIWFIVLLTIEHLSQELNRILVALSSQTLASLALFLRSGAWALIAVAVMHIDHTQRTLDFVLSCWAVGGFSACILSIVHIAQKNPKGWKSSVNWRFIKTGIFISFPFLLSTLALRGIYTFDRYWMESLTSLEIVGAYVLFTSLSNALISLLEAGVFVYSYPTLISAHNEKNIRLFTKTMTKLTKQVLIISATFCLLAVTLIDPILNALGKPVYLEQRPVFTIVIASTFIYCLGMIPQLALYAQHKDRIILESHVLALASFIISAQILKIYSPVLAIPISVLIGLTASLIWKSIAYLSLPPRTQENQHS